MHGDGPREACMVMAHGQSPMCSPFVLLNRPLVNAALKTEGGAEVTRCRMGRPSLSPLAFQAEAHGQGAHGSNIWLQLTGIYRLWIQRMTGIWTGLLPCPSQRHMGRHAPMPFAPSQWHMGCIMCPCPSHREEEDLPCQCALPGIDVPDEDDVEVIPGGGDGRGSSPAGQLRSTPAWMLPCMRLI